MGFPAGRQGEGTADGKLLINLRKQLHHGQNLLFKFGRVYFSANSGATEKSMSL